MYIGFVSFDVFVKYQSFATWTPDQPTEEEILGQCLVSMLLTLTHSLVVPRICTWLEYNFTF